MNLELWICRNGKNWRNILKVKISKNSINWISKLKNLSNLFSTCCHSKFLCIISSRYLRRKKKIPLCIVMPIFPKINFDRYRIYKNQFWKINKLKIDCDQNQFWQIDSWKIDFCSMDQFLTNLDRFFSIFLGLNPHLYTYV